MRVRSDRVFLEDTRDAIAILFLLVLLIPVLCVAWVVRVVRG